MSDQEKNIIQYSAADIIKYLNGELSPLEMHAMEKAALEDPFLADAVEGMYQSFERDHLEKFPADIHEIRSRLSQRVNQQRTPVPAPFIFGWKVAAAVLIILFAGGLTVYLVNQHPNVSPIARQANSSPKVATDSNVSAVQPNVSKPGSDKAIQAEQEIAKSEKPSSVVIHRHKKRKSVRPRSKSDLSSNEAEVLAKNKNADVNKNIPAPMAAQEKRSDAPVAQYEYRGNPSILSSFYGKVTDEHNKPIASAFIASKDKKVQALTDDDGNFKLNTVKQDSVIAVEIRSDGYNPAYITLNSHGVPNIIMLRETNINAGHFGKSNAKKRVIPEQQTDQDAEPEHGWDDYSNYLQKNKRPPNDSLGLKGIVTVSFTVDKKKKLSDFYIEQSLGPEYDAEAIRLIKEGPSWKTLKKKSATVVVVVGF
ncbi:MAG: hypothetical protein C5B59_09585 [Bacteroidetes bacterium]|nr:MAG: hypothetical protein C5B59_09585 [Bacteroidota bacterium]